MARLFADGVGAQTDQDATWLARRRSDECAEEQAPNSRTPQTHAASAPFSMPPRQRFCNIEERIDLVDWSRAEDHVEAWRDLASRASVTNAFLEPSYALTAIRHTSASARPSFLLVWSDAPKTRLVGLAPICKSSSSSDPIATCWRHAESRFGGILIDSQEGAETLGGIFTWLAAKKPEVSALLIASVQRDEVVSAVLGSHQTGRLGLRLVAGSESSHKLFIIDAFKAATTLRTDDLLIDPSSLARIGSDDDIRGALEDFLILDATEWSGSGSPLVDVTGFATFARAMTRQMAREGKCKIERLVLEDHSIASAILLKSGNKTFVWKLAWAKATVLQPSIRNFIIDIAKAEAVDGRCTIFCCDIPERLAASSVLRSIVMADVIVAPPGRDGKQVVSALRRERRRRFAREIGRHLVAIAGGLRRN